MGSDKVHCENLGTPTVMLTFKCHLQGQKDLLAVHDPRGIFKGETNNKMKRQTEENNQKCRGKNTAGGRDGLKVKQETAFFTAYTHISTLLF